MVSLFPPFLSDYRLYYCMIIWLTGQPGSGKTTLAKELLSELRNDVLDIKKDNTILEAKKTVIEAEKEFKNLKKTIKPRKKIKNK